MNIEVKRLQVEHSVSDITFPLLPHNTDEDFVQEEICATLNQALKEEHDRTQSGNFKEPYEMVKTLTRVGFPNNTWQKYVKGQRPQYDQENKNQVHLEYEARLRPTIIKVQKRWKELIRHKLGRKTFPLFGVAKGAKKSSMTAYVNLCNYHVAAMEALSVIELNGVKDLEVKISVKLAKGNTTERLSVRDLLMEYKTEEGHWVFQMVAPAGAGAHEATFANTSTRERLAANVALHPATWVMMRLHCVHGVEANDIENFLAATFETKH